jgi:general secretion pathway protein G
MNAVQKKSRAAYSSSLLGAIGWAIPLVVALATGTYLTQTRQTEDIRLKTRARDEIRAMTAALVAKRADGKPLPGTQEGLQALVDDGTLPHVPNDPWGHPYQYRNPGTERSWELYSLGPDGIESRDDIVSWNLYGGR